MVLAASLLDRCGVAASFDRNLFPNPAFLIQLCIKKVLASDRHDYKTKALATDLITCRRCGNYLSVVLAARLGDRRTTEPPLADTHHTTRAGI